MEEWKNLREKATRMNEEEKLNRREMSYKVCLCGELVKGLYDSDELDMESTDRLEDDYVGIQHLKCLGKDFANKLDGTKNDKWKIFMFIDTFNHNIFKRAHGLELTGEELEAEKNYLYLLEN